MSKAIKITIDSTVRTTDIKWQSLKIIKNLTSQVDTASFKYNKSTGDSWEPEEGKEVIIEYDTDTGAGFKKVFAGYTVNVETDVERVNNRIYTVKCKDYNYLLDQRLVVANFTSQTPKQIIDSLVAEYALGLGITTTNVETTPTVDSITFKYVSLREAIRRLADITYKDWYIDEDKDIHFFDRENNTAPFDVTDTNGNMIDGTLDIVDDLTNLKNRIVVRGTEYEGSIQIDRFVGAGTTGNEKDIFVLGYKPKLNLTTGFTLIVNGTTGVVGIEGLADEDAVVAVVNQRDKTLRFTAGNAPFDAELVTAQYTPLLPVIVVVTNTASVAEYGYREFELNDKNISSKQAAKDLGNAELDAYSTPITKGTFRTYKDNLDSGQFIDIESTYGNIDDKYLIYKLIITPTKPTTFGYTANFTSSRNLGITELLQKLLLDPNRLIGDETEDTIEKVESIVEKIAIIESVVSSSTGDAVISDDIELIEDTATAIDTPKIWVWGPYAPTGIADTKRPLFWNVGSLWTT